MKRSIVSVLTALILCGTSLPVHAYSDPPQMYGDLNSDSICNAADATAILVDAAAVGTGLSSRFTVTQQAAADLNGDGAVNAQDAAEILIFAARKGTGSRLTSNDFVYQRRLPVSVPQLPAFAGEPYTIVHNGEPYFHVSDYDLSASFEDYSAFDSLGRCRVCTANIGRDLMPTEPRGEIGMVKPSGWHTYRYDGLVEGDYLYNRCHLIAFMLAGENANVLNLITGTRYFNTQGMLPFETQVSDYVHATGNHVLYRVTPVFDQDDLVAHGALMEAYSVEDAGKGVKFCVYCYNVQPGVIVDYSTGESRLDESWQPSVTQPTQPVTQPTQPVTQPTQPVTQPTQPATQPTQPATQPTQPVTQPTQPVTQPTQPVTHSQLYYDPAVGVRYVCNSNSRKFHEPGCASVKTIKEKNRKDVSNTAEELIALGYAHCKECG